MLNDPPELWPDLLDGAVLSLTYDPVGELPIEMRKEVAAAGWRVEDASAYPWLMPMNTPAGGVSVEMMGWLTRSLRLLPDFIERHAEAFHIASQADEPVPAIEWQDPASGTILRHDPGDPILEAWLEGTVAPWWDELDVAEEEEQLGLDL